ncbi:MAG: hypothetical protein ACREE0_08975 [Phenylobacterium sp.]
MIRQAALCLLFLLGACSTVETSGLAAPVAQSLRQDRIQLRVHTGDEQMDRLVYEMAYQQFADVIPLREREPYTGYFEVTFASKTAGAYIGSSSTVAQASGTGYAWYTGAAVSGFATANGTSSTVSSGSVLEWQNSTMLAVLKRSDGERLWSADYSYKGGWEMSGWVVNTPEEAARLVTKRLKARFTADRDGGRGR